MIGRPISVCMLFSSKESTSSPLFLRHWSALIIGAALFHKPGVVATCFVQALAGGHGLQVRIYLLPTKGRKLTLRCSPRERHVPASQSWLRRPSVFGSVKNMFVLSKTEAPNILCNSAHGSWTVCRVRQFMEYIQLQRTFLFRRRPWCYCADLIPTRSTSTLSRFALFLFRMWLRVDFSGELSSGFCPRVPVCLRFQLEGRPRIPRLFLVGVA